MAPLRVAQLITTLARGGAQATVMASRHLHDHGIDVTVLAGPEDLGEGTYWPEIRADGASSADGSVLVVPSLQRAIDPVADVRALRWMIRWLRAERPDVLHTHSAKGGLIGRLAASIVGIPTVHTVHGWSLAAPRGEVSIGSKVVRRGVVGLERALALRTKALVVVTPLDTEEGLAMGVGRPDQYRVIRSGIDLDGPRSACVQREAIRQELGWGRGEMIVGTIGRLAQQKDLPTLVSGFARASLTNARLVIIGDGPDRDLLHGLVCDLGIRDRVQFLGSRSDAASLVAGFDVFAMTSRWEGLPRALVEAMAARVPVVATAVGGVPELLDDGHTGMVVPIGRPDAVAVALRAQQAYPSRAEVMAGRAADLVEPFSAQRMRAALAQLWFEVAGQGTAPVPNLDPV
ncbi:MAG: glycosyltransferase family 4 protein [Actinomycetia bacterium]|nr:glycosyltransferase family 4 protein [Actinomycetes bacterium]